MKKLIVDLTKKELNHCVAKAQGWELVEGCWRDSTGTHLNQYCSLTKGNTYRPTTNPAQWAELIEKFDMYLNKGKPYWWAKVGGAYSGFRHIQGKTPSIAICRAVVASVYGEYVEVSDES